MKAFFSHDCDARLSKKMLLLRAKHGPAGYGVYWMLVERLRAEEGFCSEKNYPMLSFDFHCDEELIRSVVEDFGLFDLSDDGKTFCSHGLNERMELAETRSKAGKRGAEARWDKNRSGMAKNGKSMASSCDANANKINKRNANNNSISITPSLNTSPKGSAEGVSEEEKEKILYEFFFENMSSPEREMTLFLDYNNRDGRVWEQMSEVRKQEAIKHWKQQPERSPRFKEDFLKLWKRIYGVLASEGIPTEIRLDALSDSIRTGTKGRFIQLCCSERLIKLLESEEITREIRPYVLDYEKSKNCNALQYYVAERRE